MHCFQYNCQQSVAGLESNWLYSGYLVIAVISGPTLSGYYNRRPFYPAVLLYRQWSPLRKFTSYNNLTSRGYTPIPPFELTPIIQKF